MADPKPLTAAPTPVVGRYLPENVAQAIHEYLTSRPYAEVWQLVAAMQQLSKPMTREPK